MKLIYEGTDISSSVQITKADFIDNAGFKADSLELNFSDGKNIWSSWKPEKNHKVQILQDGLDSGIMYIDELEQRRGTFIIRALSIPQEAKSFNSRAWESISFLELALQLSNKYYLKLEDYGINNYIYERVDQLEQSDMDFLAYRSMLEGYVLKITDNKVVIYDEAYLESLDITRNISVGEFDGNYKFLNKSTDVYKSSIVKSNGFTSIFIPNNPLIGASLKNTSIFVTSQGEADRFSRSLLRLKNKYERTGSFNIKLDTQIAAGSNISIEGIGLSDGKYFCEQVIHRFTERKTTIMCRRPLEGY